MLKLHIPTLLRLWRSSKNDSALSAQEAASVSKALLNLQRGLTGDRQLAGAGYMQDKNLLGAYLLYYWPVSYTQISFCTEYFFKALKLLAKKNELNILDIGSGPGPAACALTDAALKANAKLQINLDLFDSSSRALDLAKKIFDADYKAKVSTSCKTVNLEQADFSLLQKKYDIIVASHSLNELWKDKADSLQKKEGLLLELSPLLNDGGILLLCEPALLKTSRSLIGLRDFLAEKNMFLLAPCPCFSDECPALKAGENQTCHAEIQWKPVEPVASLAKLAKLDRTSVKMTFFAFQKNVEGLCKETKSLQADLPNEYCVVSDPMLNKSGRVRVLLCDGSRRIAFSAKKDDRHAKEIGFFNLSRYDKIALEEPELRGTEEAPAYGVTEKTKILNKK
ncbi:MAG: methyltransferase domain-containing protein [Treponema sp.]|nr:methyltransferase domain-containing protein [Treponema sp.]